MRHQAHAPAGRPADVMGWMGIGAPPLVAADTMLRAWQEGAQAMQAEAVEFVNARAAKDLAAMTEWTRCATPGDALEVQARYAREAWDDYVAGGQRMWQLLTAAAPAKDGA